MVGDSSLWHSEPPLGGLDGVMQMMMLYKNKIEAARRQLGTALALYLKDQDPVSVHCLAGAGCELIEYYAQKSGGELDIAKLRRTQVLDRVQARHASKR